MKKRMILAAFAVAVLSTHQASAGKPKAETSDDISNSMVEFVHNDVKLTKAQKETLKKKAKEYADKLMQARAMSDTAASYVFMKTVTENYQAATDSILASDQKDQYEKKRTERMNAFIVKLQSKK